MTATYTNRKGKTYYLHQGKTKLGNPKYFFALRDEGNLVKAIPPGYEVYENPNGQVIPPQKTDPDYFRRGSGCREIRNAAILPPGTLHS